ncbi:choline transporter-like protein 2 isoform X1 [Mytilus galloprovincialis]|uniref:choline transporter-like protein 2 isoform X1 n=1 Tax=Mytilus galloprovincialis TaxID=29158 RepID=UPI003F7C400F
MENNADEFEINNVDRRPSINHDSVDEIDSKNLDEADQIYGTPLKYDPNFKGPIKNRSCTDIICCLLFLIFIGGLVVVAIFAFKYGDPKLLLYPVNSNNELCGYGKQIGKNYLFFFDLVSCGRMGVGVFVTGCPTPQICVTECPDSNFIYNPARGISQFESKYCKAEFEGTSKNSREVVNGDICSPYYFKSRPVINRCVPSFLFDFLDNGGNLMEKVKNQSLVNVTDSANNTLTDEIIKEGLNVYGIFLKAKEYGEKIVEDVVTSWWMIIIGLFIATLLSLIWIFTMRWLAGIMVWFTVLVFIALFGFATWYCFWNYIDLKDTDASFTVHFAVINFNFSKPKMFLTFGIIAAIILAIVLLILLILCERIKIAIALIKEGSRAVGSMMFTLIFPFFPFILEIAVIGFWITVAVFLASTGRNQTFEFNNKTEYQFDNDTWDYSKIQKASSKYLGDLGCKDPSVNESRSEVCQFLKNQEENFVFYSQIYNLFMLFWLVNFCIALGQMSLAGAFASYYWAFHKPKDVPTFPLMGSVWRSFRYHLGSLAFGSLIIAIIQIIRVLLEYVDGKLKGSENPVAKFFVKCMKCCFWCLEKFLRFLNKNAYIMIAAHGKNFCTSAKNAFMLIMRNCVRVVVIDKVTDFLLFIGKLVIVAGSAALSFFFFDGRIDFLKTYTPTLNFYVVPIVLITVGSYVIASCFFSVYDMAVDTLFLCFLEDLERNDGTEQKPYYMGKELMKILGKKNTKPKVSKQERDEDY